MTIGQSRVNQGGMGTNKSGELTFEEATRSVSLRDGQSFMSKLEVLVGIWETLTMVLFVVICCNEYEVLIEYGLFEGKLVGSWVDSLKALFESIKVDWWWGDDDDEDLDEDDDEEETEDDCCCVADLEVAVFVGLFGSAVVVLAALLRGTGLTLGTLAHGLWFGFVIGLGDVVFLTTSASRI